MVFWCFPCFSGSRVSDSGCPRWAFLRKAQKRADFRHLCHFLLFSGLPDSGCPTSRFWPNCSKEGVRKHYFPEVSRNWPLNRGLWEESEGNPVNSRSIQVDLDGSFGENVTFRTLSCRHFGHFSAKTVDLILPCNVFPASPSRVSFMSLLAAS